MNLRPFLPEWFRSWWACKLLTRFHRVERRLVYVTKLLDDVEQREYTDGFRNHLLREIAELTDESTAIKARMNQL